MPSHFPDGRPAVLPATVAQIARRLPAAGEIAVRVGSRVEPDDTIGFSSVPTTPVLIDVAQALGVEPRNVPRSMKRKLGERVMPQQVLAKRGRRKVLAPTTGTLSAIDHTTGIAVITPEAPAKTVHASVRGYVADITPGRGALIETAAAVLQGAFGIGGEQFGVLRLLVTDRHDVITSDMIDARSAYSIVIGGAGITLEALHKAVQEQVRGVIVGGIDQSVVQAFLGSAMPSDWYAYGQRPTTAPLTVLVTEGFGIHPMAEPTFELLTRYDRQEALLDGTTTVAPPVQRPRLVIPLPRLQGGQAPTVAQEIKPGAIVRLVDEAHLGQIGRVIATNERGQLPSGLRTATATVQLNETDRIMLPHTALEVLG